MLIIISVVGRCRQHVISLAMTCAKLINLRNYWPIQTSSSPLTDDKQKIDDRTSEKCAQNYSPCFCYVIDDETSVFYSNVSVRRVRTLLDVTDIVVGVIKWECRRVHQNDEPKTLKRRHHLPVFHLSCALESD